MSQFAHLQNGDVQGICDDHMMYVKQWIHGVCWRASPPSLPSLLPSSFLKGHLSLPVSDSHWTRLSTPKNPFIFIFCGSKL